MDAAKAAGIPLVQLALLTCHCQTLTSLFVNVLNRCDGSACSFCQWHFADAGGKPGVIIFTAFLPMPLPFAKRTVSKDHEELGGTVLELCSITPMTENLQRIADPDHCSAAGVMVPNDSQPCHQ